MLSNALSHTVWVRTLSAALLLTLISAPVWAAVPGYTEDFSSGLGSFFSGSTTVHEPSGGVGGASDGYVSVSRPFPANLGIATAGAEFTGDLVADGVTGFSFWLNDLAADDPLQIHVGLGDDFGNFWLHAMGFSPPASGWVQYSVDFSTPADWVQIRGSGTFQQALQISNRLLFRHDLPPFVSNPDPLEGDFGIDRVTVLPEPTGALLLLVGSAIAARRRR